MKNRKLWITIFIAIVVVVLLEVVYTILCGSGTLRYVGSGESDIVSSIEEKIEPFMTSDSHVIDLAEVIQYDRYYIYSFITSENKIGSALFLKNKSGDNGYVVQAGIAETPVGECYFSEINTWGLYSDEQALAVFDKEFTYWDSINPDSIKNCIVSLRNNKGVAKNIYFAIAHSAE